MNEIEKYLNLLDVLKSLDKNSYEYQTLNNVMVSMYDDMSDLTAKRLEVLIKNN